MNREIRSWTVRDLQERVSMVNFPEYQREPNIWSRRAKQQLIDSMLRGFDIASLYFYEFDDFSYDCVDGRQRIAAILSFLGDNTDDVADNGFPLNLENEIYGNETHPFAQLQGQRWTDLADSQDDVSNQAQDRILAYPLTIVFLSEIDKSEDFNLQFTRLNLGTIINAGEKLHAMVGGMRDVCFDDVRIGKHPFFERVNIPTRRYAKEQVATQILGQAISFSQSGHYTRTRHYDMQRFFKEHFVVSDDDERVIEEISAALDVLEASLPGAGLLRNRAMTVSVVLLAWQLGIATDPDLAIRYSDFVELFIQRLREEVSKGLDIPERYRYLVDFQKHVTQASVERPAVEKREAVLDEEFKRYASLGYIQGDGP